MIVVDNLSADRDPRPGAGCGAVRRSYCRGGCPLISAATLLELHIVMLNRRGAAAAQIIDRLVKDAGFQIENFTAQHLELAREAYARYGKGRNIAGLNYGNCFSHALAKATGLPLLFKRRIFRKRTCRERCPILEQRTKPDHRPYYDS